MINMTLLWREVGAQVLKVSQSHQIWLADGNQSLSEVNSISTWNGCLPCRNVNYSWAVTFSKLQWDASSKTCCSSMPPLYKQACFVDCDCHKRMIKMKPSHHLSCVTIKVKSQGHADYICEPCTQNYDTNEAYQSLERKKNCTPHLP